MPAPSAPATGPAVALLRELGATDIAHPGGTLLAHLRRVQAQLAIWGANPALQLAGLCHAFYGTDGFPTALLHLDRRAELTAVVGTDAEALVYQYASCDRDVVYPQLGGVQPVVFRDRFTGAEHTPSETDLRAFLELTAANELDVLAHNEELAAQHGPGLYRLFARSRGLLSPAAWETCEQCLASTHDASTRDVSTHDGARPDPAGTSDPPR